MNKGQTKNYLAAMLVHFSICLIAAMSSVTLYLYATDTNINNIHPVILSDRHSRKLTQYLSNNETDYPPLNGVTVINTTVAKNFTGAAPVDCPPRLRFAEGLPVTALYSVPGSGNTWLRYLLQLATGIYTGSQTHDQFLKEHGFPGEGRWDGTVVAVKTHQIEKDIQAKFDRAVMIIREPYAAALADFNRRLAGHTGHANLTITEHKIRKHVNMWHFSNRAWIRSFLGPLHVVYYDALRVDVVKETKKVLQFLNWEIVPSQLQCITEHSEGNFHRKTVGKTSITNFSEEIMDFVNDCVSRMPGYLEERKAKGLKLSL